MMNIFKSGEKKKRTIFILTFNFSLFFLSIFFFFKVSIFNLFKQRNRFVINKRRRERGRERESDEEREEEKKGNEKNRNSCLLTLIW